MADDGLGGFEGTDSQQGQGLAYVLPQSRSVGYFMQLANEKAQQRRDDAAALAAQQQKANELYAREKYNETTPKVATEYTKYLQPIFDDHLRRMADFYAKTGQDPFTNTDFIQEKNDNQALAESTQGIHNQAIALATALQDKSKNYTPESASAVENALNEYGTNPIAYLNKPFPQLQGRYLDLNDAHKVSGPGKATKNTINGYNVTTPDRDINFAKSRLTLSQPEFSPMLQKQYGVNTDVGDSFSIPNSLGRPTYPTDAPTLNGIADHMIQNAAQPHYAQMFRAAGIDPSDPHAKDKLVDLAKKNNAGLSKAYGDLTDRLGTDVEPENIRNATDDRLGIAYANLDLARQRLEISKEKGEKSTAPIYRQKLVSDMLNGVPGSGEQLVNKIKADPLYDANKSELAIKVDGDNINFTIPPKRKYIPTSAHADAHWEETMPSRVVSINKKDPNADVQLNELVNQLSGEKVDISALRTQGGKKHLPVINNNASSSSQHIKVNPNALQGWNQ